MNPNVHRQTSAARPPGARQGPTGPRSLFLPAGWLSACVILILVGCAPAEPDAPEVQVELTIEPSPPKVGEAEVTLELTDAAGQPLEGAQVHVEGNMNHAGMKPSLADLREVEPGRYSGTLDFTMGGDWFLLITARTADGKTVERKIDVRGVKTQ